MELFWQRTTRRARRGSRTVLVAGGVLAAVLALGLGMSAAAPANPLQSATSAAADAGYPANCVVGSGAVWGCGTLTDAQLHQLVGMMTVAEANNFTHGGGAFGTGAGEVWNTTGVTRLGIPNIHFTDGPAGVRLTTQSTALPAPIGLTAAWDPDAASSYGATWAAAGRATGYNDAPGYADNGRQGQTVWLGPMMNQIVIPTAGRNFETLGEDENLAAAVASHEVLGSQNEGIITELKHWIDNDFENSRMSTSVYVDERTLHEGEMQAFEASIKAGGGSVMCSYNRINDIYGCSNPLTETSILRNTLGFEGWVTTDFGANHGPRDLFAGTDNSQPLGGQENTGIINNIGASATLLGPTSAGATVIKPIPSVVLATSLSAAPVAGATNIKVGSVTGLAVGQTVVIDVPGLSEARTITGPVDGSGVFNGTTGAGGTGVNLDSGLSAAHSSGVAVQALNIANGYSVSVDTGANQETATISGIGTLGANTTTPNVTGTLATAAAAGATNVKVASTTSLAAGQTLRLDYAGAQEDVAITAVGTAVQAPTTLAAPSAAGATNVKVASIAGFAVGDLLMLDSAASGSGIPYGTLETAVITGVGTAGIAGTGITVATPLTFAHVAGAVARDSGSGVTVSPLAFAHPINTQIRLVTPAGATNVKVASVSGFNVGDTIQIGQFGFAETGTITAVGTTGIGGTGITLASPTTRAHWGAEVVADLTTSGTGFALSAPLTKPHPAGAVVTVIGPGTGPVALTNDLPALPAYTGAQWKDQQDLAVYRMVKMMNKLGELEGTPFGSMAAGCDGTTIRCHAYIPGTPNLGDLKDQTFAAAQKIAEESAVLLKNDDSLLPLQLSNWSGANRVVAMGATAFVVNQGGGGSAQVVPIAGQIPSAYDTIVRSAPAGANITSTLGYSPNSTTEGFVVPSQGGSVAGSGFLREQTTLAVTPAGSAATHCTVGCAADQNDASIAYGGLTTPTTLPAGTAWRWTGAITAPPTNGPWQLRVCYGNIAANATDGSVQLYASASALGSAPVSTDRVVNVTGASATNLDIFNNAQCHNPGGSQQGVAATGAGTAIANGATRNIELRAVANGIKPLSLYLEWAPVGTTLAAASAVGATNLKVGSVAGFTVGQTVAVGTGATQEAATIAAIGTTGAAGTGIDLTAPLAIAHANASGFAGQTMQDAAIADAVAKASVPGTTPVVFVYDVGTEGSDRGGNNAAAGMVLPGYQDQLVQAVVDVNANTIVVAMTGAPVYMPWALPQPGHNAVKSILQMWYPGQRGGIATANVVLGTVDPGGKLPETFPVDANHFAQNETGCDGATNLGTSAAAHPWGTTQVGTCSLYPGVFMPGFLSTDTTGNLHNYRTINFSNSTLQDTSVSSNPSLTYPDNAASSATVPTTTGNGIFTGYRWFDEHDVAPLFPFGHGLSYTTFGYSNLTTAPTADGIDVSFDVKNTGPVAGDEVPQVYIGPPASAAAPIAVKALPGFQRTAPAPAPVPMAVKALAGFQRITLAPGATQHLTIHVAKRALQYWSVITHDWAYALGARPILVGSSSRDIRLQTDNATSPAVTITPDRAPDHNGWYNHPVTFTATAQAVAGLTVTCDPPKVYSTPDSATASVTLTCTDQYGDVGTKTVTFKYDATAPVLAPTVSPNPVAFGGTATASANATDATSGVASQSCDPVPTSTAGAHSVNCTATDVAGNTASAPASYTVATPLGGSTICTGPVSGTGKDVVVPAGATCTLVAGTHVLHDLKVAKGGTLIDLGAVIDHDLSADNPAGVQVTGGTIGHDLSINGLTGTPAGGNWVTGTTVGHDLVVQNSATAIVVSGNTVGHDLTVKNNQPGGATVSGNSAGHDAVCQSNSPQDGSGNTAVHASSCPA